MVEADSRIAEIFRWVDADFENAVARWSNLLSIPSVSTDPDYRSDTRRAAEWLAEQLRELGFTVVLHDTPGHPIVLGHYYPASLAGAPRLLYYAHYDVQPPDPLELWDTGPFKPTVVDGPHGRRMVARGAVDDKGQLMTFLEAFCAWKAVNGELPVNMTVLIEGEEEMGSPNLRPFLEQNRDALKADACIVSDTASWDIETPAITYMLRGMVYAEVSLYGPDHDLHSGIYGGAVSNPLNALTQLLAGLHDDGGRITLPGFYEDVYEPTPDEYRAWTSLQFDQEAFLHGAGVDSSGGETGRSILEKIWSRPTCDVNGLIGGYTGTGPKTVIPTHGTAKLSFRLVPDQQPEKVTDALREYVARKTPAGCRSAITLHTKASPVRIPTESPHLQAASAALAQTYGKPPVLIGCGGTIPVAAWVREVLDMDTLLMGFGLEDDRMHSPNEKFEFRCFENGIKSHVAFLQEISG